MRPGITCTVLLPALLLAACGGDTSLSEQANDFGGRGINNANMQLQPVTILAFMTTRPLLQRRYKDSRTPSITSFLIAHQQRCSWMAIMNHSS